MESTYPYEDIEAIANYLKERVSFAPQVGIVCGSGLGSLADTLTNTITFNYEDIPNFPISTVEGHTGRLVFGYIAKIPVLCLQGRFHFYEGYPLTTCVMPIRLMKLLGATTLIVSNAAGGVNSSYKVGDIMLIKDHVDFLALSGINPLRGANDERFGTRFVAMNDVYNPEYIQIAKDVATELGFERIHVGVYGCDGGPTYETVAEVKLLKTLGVDAVGMSTVHEIITAAHCNLKCFAFSLITNECVASYSSDQKPDGHGVVEAAEKKKEELQVFIETLVPRLVAGDNERK